MLQTYISYRKKVSKERDNDIYEMKLVLRGELEIVMLHFLEKFVKWE